MTKSRMKSSQAYRAIKRAIIDGVYKPGEPLRENDLSEMLSVSRTPIREALRQLHSEGLVESIANRGVYVSQLTLGDIKELFEARQGIEECAMRLCIEKMDAHMIDEAHEALRCQQEMLSRMDHAGFAKYDRMFHRALVRGAQNKHLETFWQSLMDNTQRVMATVFKYQQSLSDSYDFHKRILESVEKRDEQEAASILGSHISGLGQNMIDIMDKGA